MTHEPPTSGGDGGWYEVRLQGHLGAHWAARFDGMTLTPLADGTTVLRGLVADQAALHGLLRQLGDIGVTLLSLHQHDSDPSTATTEPGA
jgi:hypothetical protein